MHNIEKLLADIADETGIVPELRVYPFDDGWCARIVEDGHTLLCSAGEVFLVAYDQDDMYTAIEKLDVMVQQGFVRAREWA